MIIGSGAEYLPVSDGGQGEVRVFGVAVANPDGSRTLAVVNDSEE